MPIKCSYCSEFVLLVNYTLQFPKFLCYRCILPGTSWEPVPTGRPFLGSVTQSQRFSFTPNILGEFINQYIYVSCNLTVCRNYLTKKNENIPQVSSGFPLLPLCLIYLAEFL